jgi:hypothetical protein
MLQVFGPSLVVNENVIQIYNYKSIGERSQDIVHHPHESGWRIYQTKGHDQPLFQVDIGGHPPFPTGSKQFSGNFGNLLFLAVFNFRGHFKALNDVFGKTRSSMEVPLIFPPKRISLTIPF